MSQNAQTPKKQGHASVPKPSIKKAQDQLPRTLAWALSLLAPFLWQNYDVWSPILTRSPYSNLLPEDLHSFVHILLAAVFFCAVVRQFAGRWDVVVVAGATTLVSVWVGMAFTEDHWALVRDFAPWGVNVGCGLGLFWVDW